MKKFFIYLTILFSSFLILSSNIKALVSDNYVVATEEIFDYNTYNKTFNPYLVYCGSQKYHYQWMIDNNHFNDFKNSFESKNYKYYIYTIWGAVGWNDDNIQINFVYHKDAYWYPDGLIQFYLYNPNSSNIYRYLYNSYSNLKLDKTFNNTSIGIDFILMADNSNYYNASTGNTETTFFTKAYNLNGLNNYYIMPFLTNKDITYSSNNYSKLNPTLNNIYSNITIGSTNYTEGTKIESFDKGVKWKKNFDKDIGKITVEFNEYDDNINKYEEANFKFDLKANDNKKESIPIFRSYKIYGAIANGSFEELSEDDLKIKVGYDEEENPIYETLDLQVKETGIEYVEGKKASSSIRLTMKFSSKVNSLYSKFRIEFYFDNTNNSNIDCSDDIKTSSYNNSPSFLYDYQYYYYPSNYKYVYITSENEQNEGNVYIPTISTTNSNIKLQAQYYDLSTKEYSMPIVTNEFDDFYSSVNYSFNSKQKVFTLNRIKGSDTTVNNYYDNQEFTVFFGNKILDKFNYKKEFDNYLYDDENTYFYIPKNMKVYFTNDKKDLEIITNNGYVTIDPDKTTNDYEVKPNNENSLNSIIDLVKNFKIDIKGPFVFFNTIYTAIRNTNGIGLYLFATIICSIVLMIIGAMKR